MGMLSVVSVGFDVSIVTVSFADCNLDKSSTLFSAEVSGILGAVTSREFKISSLFFLQVLQGFC